MTSIGLRPAANPDGPFYEDGDAERILASLFGLKRVKKRDGLWFAEFFGGTEMRLADLVESERESDAAASGSTADERLLVPHGAARRVRPGECFFEWRAFRNRTTTISEYTHNLFFHGPVQTLFTGLFVGGILVHFAEFGALHCP